MTKQQAVDYFGSVNALARAVSRDRKQVWAWPDGELTEHNERMVKAAMRKAQRKEERA